MRLLRSLETDENSGELRKCALNGHSSINMAVRQYNIYRGRITSLVENLEVTNLFKAKRINQDEQISCP